MLTDQNLGSIARPRSDIQRGITYGRVQLVELTLVILVSFLHDVPTQSLALEYGLDYGKFSFSDPLT